ncbi:MAG TPA: hypothetical protein VFB06_34505 [Streptosporangiaceae bacterium]|nr:hypothetical protein [Streptosporangiaceae bacterium]
MTQQPQATGLPAYEMVSMVVGSGQMHFFSDHDRARVKARALRGLVFRVPIFEDYRPQDGAAPLPGWTNVDPWEGTDLADPPAEHDYNSDELYEIETVLTDAGVATPGVAGVAELVGERDGYRDRAYELDMILTEAAARAAAADRRIAELERERDDALAHLHQATQPSGFSHAQRLVDMPPIARAATEALSGPESLGLEPVVPVEYPAGFAPAGQPWCPPLRAVPELGVNVAAGYALGRGLAVPEVPEEERSGGLAFHR